MVVNKPTATETVYAVTQQMEGKLQERQFYVRHNILHHCNANKLSSLSVHT